MAITTTYQDVLKKYQPTYWETIEDFEKYYLKNLSEIGQYNYYTDKKGIETFIPPVNHFPELKEYEVWMEGYMATGEHGTAQLLGKVKARNFAQACHIFMCKQYLNNIDLINSPNYKEYIDAGRWDYDPSSRRLWNCGLYWSEELAKKTC